VRYTLKEEIITMEKLHKDLLELGGRLSQLGLVMNEESLKGMTNDEVEMLVCYMRQLFSRIERDLGSIAERLGADMVSRLH
jgi:hypothetical protein